MLKKIKSTKGVVTLETALMIGFIFMLIGGIFVGGQLIINKNTLNSAMYNAARKASVCKSLNEATITAKNSAAMTMASGLGIENSSKNPKTIQVQLVPDNNSWKKGNRVLVKVTIDMRTIFPIPDDSNPIFADTKYTMTSSMYMMIEDD